MKPDAEPPFAAALAEREASPAALFLPNGSTQHSQLEVSGDQPPFAPNLLASRPPHEESFAARVLARDPYRAMDDGWRMPESYDNGTSRRGGAG